MLSGNAMKMIPVILMSCLLSMTNNMAFAATTAETVSAAKAKEIADAANAEAEAAAAEASKAADVAEKAAATAKAAAATKAATAKAAKEKAKEKTAAAKKSLAAAVKGGARSCDAWKDERSTKNNNGSAAAWFSGFLSGISIARNQDFLTDTSTPALYLLVDGYCDSNPNEFISDAGIHIYLELARKKGIIE
jgi:hypothetical protein